MNIPSPVKLNVLAGAIVKASFTYTIPQELTFNYELYHIPKMTAYISNKKMYRIYKKQSLFIYIYNNFTCKTMTVKQKRSWQRSESLYKVNPH